MIRRQLIELWAIVWRLAIALAIAFGILGIVIWRTDGDAKGLWLMAFALIAATTGEMKDVATSQAQKVSGNLFKRLVYYFNNMNLDRLYLRVAEWGSAAIAAYLFLQLLGK